MNLTNIPTAEEVRNSYNAPQLREKWEEKIAETVKKIREEVAITNANGKLNTTVQYATESNPELDYVTKRFEEKGFTLFRCGYGILGINWDVRTAVQKAPPKRP